MPACFLETAGSARTTVLPATEPIVVTASVSGNVWFAIGPRMNSRRATGAQPQNRHFCHCGIITRLQPWQVRALIGAELFFAADTMMISTSRAAPMMMPARAELDTGPSLVDRLEFQVRLAQHDH